MIKITYTAEIDVICSQCGSKNTETLDKEHECYDCGVIF